MPPRLNAPTSKAPLTHRLKLNTIPGPLSRGNVARRGRGVKHGANNRGTAYYHFATEFGSRKRDRDGRLAKGIQPSH
jgi:hypothetical protein